MAISIKTLERTFIFGKNTLSDPNPEMTPDEVLSFYTNTYPDLINATTSGPVMENDKATYTFKVQVGTKG